MRCPASINFGGFFLAFIFASGRCPAKNSFSFYQINNNLGFHNPKSFYHLGAGLTAKLNMRRGTPKNG
jgi:hypothetical protein